MSMEVAIAEQGQVIYWCPGCKHLHCIPFSAGPCVWGFNNDLVKPTLTPSVNSGPGFCHHFVRDGKIQFLTDCKHALAGQTVEMVPEPRKVWSDFLNENQE